MAILEKLKVEIPAFYEHFKHLNLREKSKALEADQELTRVLSRNDRSILERTLLPGHHGELSALKKYKIINSFFSLLKCLTV